MHTLAWVPIHIYIMHTHSNRKELLSHSFNRINICMLVGTQEASEKVVTLAMERKGEDQEKFAAVLDSLTV